MGFAKCRWCDTKQIAGGADRFQVVKFAANRAECLRHPISIVAGHGGEGKKNIAPALRCSPADRIKP
jgi:hypothetical protein